MQETSLRRARDVAVLTVSVWFLASLVGGYVGIFNTSDELPLSVAYFIGIPMALGVLAYLLNTSFRAFADSLDLRFLVFSHTWRFVGIGFVLAWYPLHLLPAGFGIPEGLGDILAAGLAIPLALAIHHGTVKRKWFVVWNIYSLTDLISAITVGILFSPSSLGLFVDGGLTTALMVTFPISLIPTFLVPLFILTHLLMLARCKEVSA